MDTDLRDFLLAEDYPRDVETPEFLHVVKPVDFGESVDAVRQVVVFWALFNEPVGQVQ
jgi:hypothetical protein